MDELIDWLVACLDADELWAKGGQQGARRGAASGRRSLGVGRARDGCPRRARPLPE